MKTVQVFAAEVKVTWWRFRWHQHSLFFLWCLRVSIVTYIVRVWRKVIHSHLQKDQNLKIKPDFFISMNNWRACTVWVLLVLDPSLFTTRQSILGVTHNPNVSLLSCSDKVMMHIYMMTIIPEWMYSQM